MNQRWRARRAIFRRPDEQIKTSEYDVESIADDRTARDFVIATHYSQSYPAARFRFGLYRHGELAGVAVFSHPCNDRSLSKVFPDAGLDAVELGRFVLLDEVPGNGETWMIARCFEQLRRHEGITGVVAFSDPVPRTTSDGRLVFPGHLGTIYQASNAVYLGRGTARTLRLLPDGRVLAPRTLQKIRARERGWSAAVQLLQAYGAGPLPAGDPPDAARWLREWLPRLTRPLRHPGNLKYAFSLSRRLRLKKILPYPKSLSA